MAIFTRNNNGVFDINSPFDQTLDLTAFKSPGFAALFFDYTGDGIEDAIIGDPDRIFQVDPTSPGQVILIPMKKERMEQETLILITKQFSRPKTLKNLLIAHHTGGLLRILVI